MILRVECPYCAQPIEFPDELREQMYPCPGCGKRTLLRATVSEVRPAAKIVQKTEFIGWGCVVQLAGLAGVWKFPVGTIIGVALLVVGGRMSIKSRCSACGNPVTDKTVKLCPTCHSNFTV